MNITAIRIKCAEIVGWKRKQQTRNTMNITEQAAQMLQEIDEKLKHPIHSEFTKKTLRMLKTAIKGLLFMVNEDSELIEGISSEACDNDGRGCRACERAEKDLTTLLNQWNENK